MTFKPSSTVPPRQKPFKPELLEYSGPYKKAIEIAQFYGFHLVEPLKSSRKDKDFFKNEYKRDKKTGNPRFEAFKNIGVYPEERLAVMRYYMENDLFEFRQPILLVHTDRDARRNEGFIKLEVIGSNKSLSEAFLIHVSKVILEEEGQDDVCVFMNTTGDKEEEKEYREHLKDYFREHINLLDPDCRQAFSADPYDVYSCTCQTAECRSVKEGSPRSVGFLSEHSRKHFMDILEHLEVLNIPYQIDPSILGHRYYRSKEGFEIRDSEGEKVLSKGERAEELSAILGYKRAVPFLSMSVAIPRIGRSEKFKEVENKKSKKPLIYFTQIGDLAKKQAPEVLETLRKANINVEHLIFKDDMGSQKREAKIKKAKYIIILGQKEATEKTIIIREVGSRSQETIPIEDLASYVKKLK